MRDTPDVGSEYPPISDYALLSDCHSGALVSRDGSVDWCVFHRFEARPVFARLLDWERGGFFQIAPTGEYEATRKYVPNTNVLETRFETPNGVATLTDALVVRVEDGHPDHRLVRRLQGESGEVEIRMRLEPRFDYGLTEPRVELLEQGLLAAYGGPDALVLQAELDLEVPDSSSAEAVPTLKEGDDVLIALTWCLPQELNAERVPREQILGELDGTVGYWQAWSERSGYQGPYRNEVQRSGLVLKGLTNSPTGAIVAAPTTSLPEKLGGGRNWDYRYSWIRDSALTINALFMLGYTEEARDYVTWLKRTTAGSPKSLQIMYGAGGERFLPEVELDHLEGYRRSKPVRVGNDAAKQFQLDVYGEMLDAAWHYRRHGGEIDDVFWDFLRQVGDAVLEMWQQPDSGIWEIRGDLKHFVSSKVLAWVALDRLSRIAEADERSGDVDAWKKGCEAIRRAVDEQGVDPETNAFRQYFGDDGRADAANLLIPIVGFVDFDDPRAKATTELVAKELAADGFVRRYVTDGMDGVGGDEGAFLICSFWLVECLARGGDEDRARELFERLVSHCNDVGLLAEEVDPSTGELLGNFPQAFSHLGLIQAAIALDMPESLTEEVLE
jgi:GH15 family glucan-1,4-alpha-glucosidase